MRYAIIAVMIYLAVAVQTTFGNAIQIGRISPQIPAMVAAAIVLLLGRNQSLVIAALIGLLEDALWPGRMGVATAWYLFLSWGLLETTERFDLQPLNRRIAATGLFATLLALGTGLTRYTFGEPTVDPTVIAASAVGVGLYTTALAIPFWLVLHGVESTLLHRNARYQV